MRAAAHLADQITDRKLRREYLTLMATSDHYARIVAELRQDAKRLHRKATAALADGEGPVPK
jgi:hypothetical protein